MVGRPFRPVLLMVGKVGDKYIPPVFASVPSAVNFIPSELDAIESQLAFIGAPVC